MVSVNPVIYNNAEQVNELKRQLEELDRRLKKLEAWAAEYRVELEKIDAYIAERKKMESDGK